tara:strand:- start:3584 stop:4603 length:1020 start_codon:yes stop_codon:yes gene_type:complete
LEIICLKMSKKIFFKFSLSNKIGTGHFFRTMNLAKKFLSKNAKIFFIIRDIKLQTDLVKKNFNSRLLKKTIFVKDEKAEIRLLQKNKATNLFIDDPNFNIQLQKKYKKIIKGKLILYQDIPKKNFADIILNHNYIKNPKKIYKNLSKEKVQLFTNIKFFPKEIYKKINKKSKKIRILVFFGGLANKKLLNFVLSFLNKNVDGNLRVNCFTGHFSKDLNIFKKKFKNIEFQKSQKQSFYHYQLRKSDLFIGAGGTSLIESLINGIPSIVFCTAKNQIYNCKNLSKDKYIIFIKDKKSFPSRFNDLFQDIAKFKYLKKRANKISKIIGSRNIISDVLPLLK